MRLSDQDLSACSRVLQELYTETSLALFPDRLLDLLAGVVPVEHLAYNEFNDRKNRYTVLIKPGVPQMQRYMPPLIEHLHQHPLYGHYLERGLEPKKISDFVTVRQLKKTDIYHEVYSHLSTRHQMIFFVQGGGDARIGMSLNRWHRDFSERDRAVLSFLSPHVTQAYKNAQAATEMTSHLNGVGEGLGAMHRAVILANVNGQIQWCSPLAREWLTEFFPHASPGQTLPVILKAWLARMARKTQSAKTLFTEFHMLPRAGFRLICYCGKTKEGQFTIVLIRERARIDSEAAQSLALTPREAEILFWISEAKTNPEMAAILKVSLRTVHKHVEHLFKKLDVENRLAAQRLGLELRRL